MVHSAHRVAIKATAREPAAVRQPLNIWLLINVWQPWGVMEGEGGLKGTENRCGRRAEGDAREPGSRGSVHYLFSTGSHHLGLESACLPSPEIRIWWR